MSLLPLNPVKIRPRPGLAFAATLSHSHRPTTVHSAANHSAAREKLREPRVSRTSMAAAAAAAAAVHPWPTSLPPARRVEVEAWRVRAAGAVLCLYVAAMWLLFWGLSAIEIGQLAYGDDSPVVAAACKVVAVAGCTLLLVLPLGVAPAMAFLAARPGAATANIEAPKAPAPKSTGEALRDALRDPSMIACLMLTAVGLLAPIGELIKGDSPVKGSDRERIGSVINHVGLLGIGAVGCLAVCPILTVKMWRTWRMVE